MTTRLSEALEQAANVAMAHSPHSAGFVFGARIGVDDNRWHYEAGTALDVAKHKKEGWSVLYSIVFNPQP